MKPGSTDHERPKWEHWAAAANDALGPIQSELEQAANGSDFPVVHVVGPPRSGTTLAMQIATSATDIGYISNFAAAFWKAPALGVLISRHLIGENRSSEFKSEYGQTSGPHEPHEFGRFWRSSLGYRSMKRSDHDPDLLDVDRVAQTLRSVGWAWQRPVAFKSFLAVWHLADLFRVLPNSVIVRVHRDPCDVALSHWRMYTKRLARGDKWESMLPHLPGSLDNMGLEYRVAAQVLQIESDIEEQVRKLPTSNVLDVRYEQLAKSPMDFVEELRDRLTQRGHMIDVRGVSGFQYVAASRASNEERDWMTGVIMTVASEHLRDARSTMGFDGGP